MTKQVKKKIETGGGMAGGKILVMGKKIVVGTPPKSIPPSDWEKEFDNKFHWKITHENGLCECEEIKTFIRSLLFSQLSDLKRGIPKIVAYAELHHGKWHKYISLKDILDLLDKKGGGV